MKQADFEKKMEGHCTVYTFGNTHDEIFKIYRPDGPFGTILFSGDETGGEVLPLFNPKFNIWSSEELYKLGEALQALSAIKKEQK